MISQSTGHVKPFSGFAPTQSRGYQEQEQHQQRFQGDEDSHEGAGYFNPEDLYNNGGQQSEAVEFAKAQIQQELDNAARQGIGRGGYCGGGNVGSYQ